MTRPRLRDSKLTVPEPPTPRVAKRRALILRLVREGRATNQELLVEALKAHGVETSQRAVSQDLNALGLVRGASGWAERVEPGDAEAKLARARALWRELHALLGKGESDGKPRQHR